MNTHPVITEFRERFEHKWNNEWARYVKGGVVERGDGREVFSFILKEFEKIIGPDEKYDYTGECFEDYAEYPEITRNKFRYELREKVKGGR